MRVNSFLTTLAFVTSTAHAATNTLANNCNASVWYTQVDGNQHASDTVELHPNASANEAQFFHNSGTAIKFTKTADGLWNNKPTLVFAYSYDAGKSIYYSLDTVGGFDFSGKKITLKGDGVPSIIWNGTPGSTRTEAYIHGEKNLTLTLCA